MTQPPESTTPPDDQRHVANHNLIWSRAIAAIFVLVIFWTIMREIKNAINPHHGIIGATHIFVAVTLKTPLERYRIDYDDYPSTAQGLQVLLKPPRGMEKNWGGPYLDLTPPDKMPPDPWGHAYRYAYPSIHASTASASVGPDGLPRPRQSYDVWSLGPDGIDGTADDIGNW